MPGRRNRRLRRDGHRNRRRNRRRRGWPSGASRRPCAVRTLCTCC